MTDPAHRLASAEHDAADARARLSSTMTNLQAKLDPRTLARSTVDEIADRSSAIAKAGVDGAQRNPGIVKGLAILAGLIFVVRPVAKMIRTRTRKK